MHPAEPFSEAFANRNGAAQFGEKPREITSAAEAQNMKPGTRLELRASKKLPDSENSVKAQNPRRSEERPYETVQDAKVAPPGKFSGAGQWLLLAFVQLYRVFLSPFLGGACKFYPSCSQYAQEAITVAGAKRGSILALKRLGRCRPFTKGGFDPVPDSPPGDEDFSPRHAHTPANSSEQVRASGPVAAMRDGHDYSDAEWLRTLTKELAQ